jgi:hypothetical protein
MTDCRLEYMVWEPEVVGSNPTGATRSRSAVAQRQSAVTTLIQNFVGHLIRRLPDCRYGVHGKLCTNGFSEQCFVECPYREPSAYCRCVSEELIDAPDLTSRPIRANVDAANGRSGSSLPSRLMSASWTAFSAADRPRHAIGGPGSARGSPQPL